MNSTDENSLSSIDDVIEGDILLKICSIGNSNTEEFNELTALVKKNLEELEIESTNLKVEAEILRETTRHAKSTTQAYYQKKESQKEEEDRLCKSISKLETELKKSKSEHQQLIEEVKQLKETNKLKKYAYKEAQKVYSNVFDMDISVKDSDGPLFTAIVTFNFAKNYPLIFKIDRKNRVVTDWSANSLLNSNEENELKKKLTGINYMPSILNYLRKPALDKVKMS